MWGVIMLTKALPEDLNRVDQLAIDVITFMKQSGIPQWDMSYPRFKHFEKDVEQGGLYKLVIDGMIVAVMAMYEENDPPYKTIQSWKKDHSIVLHRILVDPKFEKQGLATQILDFAKTYAIEHGYESIKIDTHLENYKMRSFLTKNGFEELEYLKVIDRLAYELVLEGNHE